jgi:hypothetical protein
VFAHGIWADGSSFSKLIPPLQADGHEVIAAQYGLDTVAGGVDVAAVKSSLGRVKSPRDSRRPFIWRPTHHSRRDRSPRCWSCLYRRIRAGRRRNVTEPAGQIPGHRRFLPRRGRGWSRMDETRFCGRTCLKRSRNLSGRPTLHRQRTYSIRRARGRLGDRSRVGTSPRTAPYSLSWNASSRGAWGQQHGLSLRKMTGLSRAIRCDRARTHELRTSATIVRYPNRYVDKRGAQVWADVLELLEQYRWSLLQPERKKARVQ